MSADVPESVLDEILSHFSQSADASEPRSTEETVAAFSYSREVVVDGLERLTERGTLRKKELDETTIWWLPIAVPPQSTRTRQEQEERRRLDLFENIQDIANVGAWEYDIESDDGWGTDQIRRIHGIGMDEYVSPTESVEFYHPEDRPTVRTAFERAVEQQEPYDLELRFLDADDNLRWVRVRGQPKIEDGDPVAVHGTMQDITERKRRQEELERFQTIVENIDDGIFVIDTDRTLEYANPPTLEYAETSLSEITGMPVSQLSASFIDSQQDRARFKEAMEAVFEGDDRAETAPTIDITLSLPSGSATIEYRFSPLDTEQGRKVIVVARDISEREEHRRRYETLVNNFPNGAVTLVDENLTYQLAGGELLDGLDLSAEEIEGTDVGMIAAGGRDDIEAAYRRALDGEEVATEVTVGERVLDFQAVPVYDESGNVHAATGMTQDVTEKREREQELERLSRAIEAAPNGTVITDATSPENPMIYVNDQFTEITGYERDDAVGRNCRFLQGEDTADEPVRKLRTAIDDEEPETVELCNYTQDGEKFWNRVSIAPVENADGTVVNFVGFQQDITDQKLQETKLRQREATLEELQTTTQNLLETRTESVVGEEVVRCLARMFDLTAVSLLWFNQDDGVLESASLSTEVEPYEPSLEVDPGENVVWQAYHTNETKLLQESERETLPVDFGAKEGDVVVAPVGDFGVVLLATRTTVDENTIEGMELLAGSGEAVLERIRQERKVDDISTQVRDQQSRVDELETILEAVQTIQTRMADSQTQEAIETAVCEELVQTENVAFAWIGHPRTVDTDLNPAVWAGDAAGYLDKIDTSNDSTLPAQLAAEERQRKSIPRISQRVRDAEWAKTALSHGFESVLSLPIAYDGVLYGVLTAYGNTIETFDEIHELLLEDVAALLGNYVNLIGQRRVDDNHQSTVHEYDVTGPQNPLHTLAVETGATIQFQTVLETTETATRILVRVPEGDIDAVVAVAGEMNRIRAAHRVGKEDTNQMSLTIQNPFFSTLVRQHGGRLLAGTADGETATITVQLSANSSHRPLVSALTSQYNEIELLSQRQTTNPRVTELTTPKELLTDRQFEILRAAYHGGYYETPREMTAEDIAADFDISQPVVYDHLQAAHRSLLSRAFEPQQTHSR